MSAPFLIDTHCHLDAAEFDPDRDAVVATARDNGVGAIVIPAVGVSNFLAVAKLAHSIDGGAYALGIHPMVTPQARDDDIAALREAVERALEDPRFIGIGEIGLDLFVASLTTPEAFERQTWFFDQQLKIARDFDLPVLLHVRRAQDPVLAGLRRVRRGRGEKSATGIAHAFNGSHQQADNYLSLGFKLGFGGATTFERALRIRALARELPIDAIVLETDAPDIAPAWLHETDRGAARNAPGELARIAGEIATLRATTIDVLAAATTRNAHDALPRLASAPGGSARRQSCDLAPSIRTGTR
jgi:TatD DNase family protein